MRMEKRCSGQKKFHPWRRLLIFIKDVRED